MTALTHRQRVKVNAALASIHGAGFDPQIASRAAKTFIAGGKTPADAYTLAINSFLATMPVEAQLTVEKIVDLIHHSDDATVAQYDAAINSYNQTGDESSSLAALYPMMARDGVALALQRGEITQADIDAGDVADALGYDPTPEQIGALQSPAPTAPVAAPEPAPAPQVFDRTAASQAAPQVAPSQQTGIVRDQHGVSFSSRRIAAPAKPAAVAGIARDQTGVSYSGARHGAKADQWAGRTARPTAFQPIVRQPVEQGTGGVLEKAGAQLTG